MLGFGKKEMPNHTATINPNNLRTAETALSEEVQETKQEEPKQELTINDVLMILEQRIINLEAALLRIRGAI